MSADKKELGVVPSGRDARSDERHTPLPWRAQDNGVFYQGDGWRELIASTSTERSQWRAIAAFIVLSANAHHGLVEALRELLDAFDASPDDLDAIEYVAIVADAKSRARAILSKLTEI